MTRFERLFVWLERLFVWLGGATFVGSLVVCAYYYALVWDSAPMSAGDAGLRDGGAAPWGRGAPLVAVAADTVLFGLFAAHHSLLARDAVKDRLARVVPERLLRSVYVWIASLLLLSVCTGWQRVGGEIYRATGWRMVVHAAVQLTGLLIIARSVGAIDALELAGIRRRASRDALQVAGPYRWVRHPLYLGWMLAAFGAPHMTGDRLAFAAISSLYLVVAIPWEERSLARGFPGEYQRYQRQVRWRVLPFVY